MTIVLIATYIVVLTPPPQGRAGAAAQQQLRVEEPQPGHRGEQAVSGLGFESVSTSRDRKAEAEFQRKKLWPKRRSNKPIPLTTDQGPSALPSWARPAPSSGGPGGSQIRKYVYIYIYIYIYIYTHVSMYIYIYIYIYMYM